jgi:hypothetical protein
MLKESTYLQRKIFRTPWHIDVASWHCGLHKTNEGASTWSVRLRLITEKRIIHQQEERLKIILKNAPLASLLPEKQTWSAIGLQRQLIAMLDAETETEQTDLFTGVARRCSSMYKTYSGNCCPELATIARGIQHSAPPPSESPMRNFLASSCRDPQTSFSPSSPSTFNASTVEAPALSLYLTTLSHDNARLAHVFVSYAHIIPSFLSHSMPSPSRRRPSRFLSGEFLSLILIRLWLPQLCQLRTLYIPVDHLLAHCASIADSLAKTFRGPLLLRPIRTKRKARISCFC